MPRSVSPAKGTSSPARTNAAGANGASAQGRAKRRERRNEEHRLLAQYARTRDPILLGKLVDRFMPLARHLASRYAGGQEPFEDLEQTASLGLINAISRFDPDRGLAFTSFAVPTILGELRRHFRDRTWPVHVERTVKDRAARVERAVNELTNTRGGRSPSVEEIAGRVDLSPEEVVEAINAKTARYALSVDQAPSGDDEEGSSLVERMGKEEPGYDAVEYGASFASVVAGLGERERVILHMRFVEDMTQSEIAAQVGVSQMQVSRILRATLSRLREQVPEGKSE
jgi:RNA polymerase sigma-B factor